MISVVNVVPNSLSGESNQDSEPNIAVNPANPDHIAITAFTPHPTGGSNAPIYVSTDGGTTWSLNAMVPSMTGSTYGTFDITPRFAGRSGNFYAGILRDPPLAGSSRRLNVLRTGNFTASAPMTILDDRPGPDQPYTQAATVPAGPDAGRERVYVGLNDLGIPGGRTATVEQSLDAAVAAPAFTPVRIESRGTGTAGQDGPQVRPMPHPDGTVYVVFYGWRTWASGAVTSDIVVVRDDNWGAGANAFTALVDPTDGNAGIRVAAGIGFTWNAVLGQERLGGDLSIAVDPANSSVVYVAYCDVRSGSYTIHVRRSTNRGAAWSGDLRAIGDAKNPALAINSRGQVGLAYQHLATQGSAQEWETHFELTADAFTTVVDEVLCRTDAATPRRAFFPYLGDYIHMMAVGPHFCGTFCASNRPDLASYPHGVTFLRNHDFTNHRLLAGDGVTPVAVSIDPYFFKVTTNEAPTVDLGPDLTVDEGQSVQLAVLITDDDIGDEHRVTWSWGDGTPDEVQILKPSTSAQRTAQRKHVWGDNGTYTVTVTVRDFRSGVPGGGQGTDSLEITVRNVAPVVALPMALPAQPWPGQTVVVTAHFTDAGWPDRHAAQVDWGDGTTAGAAGLVETNGPPKAIGTVTAGHEYALPGTYTVTVSVSDDDGGAGTARTIVGVEMSPDMPGVVDTTNELNFLTWTGALPGTISGAEAQWREGVGVASLKWIYEAAGWLYFIQVTPNDIPNFDPTQPEGANTNWLAIGVPKVKFQTWFWCGIPITSPSGKKRYGCHPDYGPPPKCAGLLHPWVVNRIQTSRSHVLAVLEALFG